MTTTNELCKHFVSIKVQAYGHYKVTIEYRGKLYSCTTNNSMAYDRWTDAGYINDRKKRHGYTLKQALFAMYNECKKVNGLK